MRKRTATYLKVGVGLLGLIVLLWNTVFAEFVPRSRTELAPNAVSLTLAVDKPTYTPDEFPSLCATLTNNSKETILVAIAQDGSDRGRAPSCLFEITYPMDTPEPEPIGICGNTNPITAEVFQTVSPGQSIDVWPRGIPLALMQQIKRGPGKYTATMTYSTYSENIDVWLGGPLRQSAEAILRLKIQPLVNRVPLFSVTSNSVSFEILNPPEAALSHDS